MEAPVIHLWAVVVCGAVSFLLGSLWYAPFFLGRIYFRLRGTTQAQAMQENAKRNMSLVHTVALLAHVAFAYILAWMVGYFHVTTWDNGLVFGLWIAFGFAFLLLLPLYLYENKPWGLFGIQVGLLSVSIIVNCVILGVW